MPDKLSTVWKFGPHGELSVGSIDWKETAQFAGSAVVAGIALAYFDLLYAPLVIIGFFACLLAGRLTRIRGSDDLRNQLIAFCWLMFAIPSVFGLIAYFVAQRWDKSFGAIAWSVFFWSLVLVLGYFNVNRLLQWEPPVWWIFLWGSESPYAANDPRDLARMLSQMETDAEMLVDIPDVQQEMPELQAAWEKRDLQQVSILLHEVTEASQQIWGLANLVLNRALQYTDIARGLVAVVTAFSEAALEGKEPSPYKLVRAGKRARSEMARLIPKSLTARGIQQSSNTITRGGGRALAQSIMGKAPPLVSVAVFAATLVADQVYLSRTLRRLKDAEGEVMKALNAVVGDLAQVRTLLKSRFIPDMERVVALCDKFRVAIEGVDDPAEFLRPEAKERIEELRVVVTEAKMLMATMGTQ